MGRETGNNPETEQRKERLSIRDLWRLVKDKVSGQIDNIIPSSGIDKEIEAFISRYKKSASVSKMAGEYFQSLIPRSSHRPKVEYIHQGQEPLSQEFIEQFQKSLVEIQSQLPRREHKQAKREFIKEVANAPMTETVSEVAESNIGGGVVQDRLIISEQAGGSNMIKEEVINAIIEHEGETGGFTSTNLTVENGATRQLIELNQLLPNNYHFRPASTANIQYREVETNGQVYRKAKFPPVDLKNYEGTSGSGDGFCESHFNHPELKESFVSYGNLTKHGGMLSLLHEVAHAWQSVYGNNEGRHNFEEFIDKVGRSLSLVNEFKGKVTQGEWTQDDYERFVLSKYKEELAAIGVEFNEKQFNYNGGNLNSDEARLWYDIEDEEFMVKSERFVPLIEDYVSQERDAWAHALRVLRFFRRQGIDLEPQLKNLSDVKAVIEPALDSYQRLMDKTVTTTKPYKQFNEQKV